MKLSDRTIQILKNFSTFNQSILVRQGNVIKTVTPLKTAFVQATVTENFTQEFAIYDLPRFLGTISLFSDPEFDFQEKYVTISSGKQRVNYTYADSSMFVTAPTKDITFPNPEIEFIITSEQLSTIAKAGAVLQTPEIAVVCADGVISIRAVDSNNPTADVFSIDIAEAAEDKNFKVIFNPALLRLIPSDYKVSITTQGISRFEADNLTYWIATETK